MYAFALSVLAPAASARGRSTTVMLSSYVAVFSAGILLFSSVKWYFEDTEDAFFLNRLKKLSAAPEAYLQLCLARITEPEKYDYNGNLDTQVLLGKFIRDNYQKGTVFVYDQMGRVPYIAGTDYYFIDSLGLTDRTIGRFEFYARSNFVLRLYEKISRGIIAGVFPDAAGYGFTPGELVEYTFSKKPDVLMCLSFVRSALINTIAADERFKEGYRLHCLLHAVLVIERKGLLKKPFNVPAGLPVLFPQDILRDPYLSGHPWVAPFVKDDAVRPEEQARQN
jgi:hypothetical protein